MQGENKINLKIITSAVKRAAQRLLVWLFNGPTAVVDACPIHRDIHLHSAEAITVWLSDIDRSQASKQADRGGASREN